MLITLPKDRVIEDYGKADLEPIELVKGFLDGSIPFPGRRSHLRLVIDNTQPKEKINNGNKQTRTE
jgi:hypothetical protein